LMGHVLDSIRAQVSAHVGKAPDRDDGSQQSIAFRRQLESMRGILRAMSPRDREILRRFYLDEQTEEQICSEMELNPVQFKILKLRAATRFVKAAGKERGDTSCKSA
jgi:DNA-directed RNA polymerase specialized sigma24 family protein